jgi:class 3 adenylate cyclase
MESLVGDIAGLIEVLSPGEKAVLIGHDWGAPQVWNSALIRPDRVRAVCGLSVPYLDHDKRALDFAIEMLGILRRFNIDRGFQLGIQIGIHSGDIVAGIVGKSRVVYDIWGETVKQAHALSQACPCGAVMVSEVVHHRLEDLYQFEPTSQATPGNKATPGSKAWRLTGAKVGAASELPALR